MAKDDQRMITPEMSLKLAKRVFSAGSSKSLNKSLGDFLKNEPHCREAIGKLLYAYNKIVFASLGTIVPPNVSVIDEQTNAINNYTQLIIQNAFAAGLAYGMARSETEFMKIVDAEIANQDHDNIDSLLEEIITGKTDSTNIENLFGGVDLNDNHYLEDDQDDLEQA